jgi:glycosyltransferase involved in cell wall biosynthesis
MEDISRFTQGHATAFFQIQQRSPLEYGAELFQAQFQRLRAEVDLAGIGLVVAEYVEALPLVHLMRKAGHSFPAIFIPHTNPYPLDTLSLFLLQVSISHPGDVILCGSDHAARAYERVLGMHARSLCTFGIKDERPERRDRTQARAALGLPEAARLLLYTGRLMDDKGIRELIEVVTMVRQALPEVRLVLSSTHIAPAYYNSIAGGLRDTVLFYRLERTRMADLYASADLFVSCATSVFETYGKSPLEAIAAGVPVVLPRWNGFPHYVAPENGLLAEVDCFDQPQETPFQFARVDLRDFTDKCIQVLRNPAAFSPRLPAWGCYSTSVAAIQNLVDELLAGEAPELPRTPTRFLGEFGLDLDSLSIEALHDCGILSRRDLGSTQLRKHIHDKIFIEDD